MRLLGCFSQEKNQGVKGLVHPKMSILSLITYPHVMSFQSSFIFGTQFDEIRKLSDPL